MNRNFMVVPVIVFVSSMAFAFSPQVLKPSNLSIDQVQTVSSKTYPAGTRPNCAWFVEAVYAR